MQTLLIVDTCGPVGGVALAAFPLMGETLSADRGAEILAVRDLPGRETQEKLMTSVAEVLQEASLSVSGIDVLAVVSGPGSFTGVRVGMAAVKGLAESLGKPVVAVSRLAVLAAQAHSVDTVQAWIDAGRGDVFAGRYCRGICLGEAMLRHQDASAAAGADTLVVMEEGLPVPSSAAVQRVPAVGLREALPLALARARAGNFADVALLDANYLRVPDAELARQARLLAAAGSR